MNLALRSVWPQNSRRSSTAAAAHLTGSCTLPSKASHVLLILPILASAWVTAGCSGPDSSANSRPSESTSHQTSHASTASGEATASQPGSAHTITSSRGAYVITFSPAPKQIPLNELFTLDVQVVDAARGVPIGEDTQLAVDAGMPAHRHGMNTRPSIEPKPAGKFLVDGMLFHMPGEWELYFDVTRNGVTERARETVILD